MLGGGDPEMGPASASNSLLKTKAVLVRAIADLCAELAGLAAIS